MVNALRCYSSQHKRCGAITPMSLRNPSRSTLGLYLFLLMLWGAIARAAGGGEDVILDLLKPTPLFASDPITLTPEEREHALAWPITKVYVTTERLILNRTDPGSGRTTAFFYMIRVNDERWKADFQFWMREISDAYWSEEILPGSLLAQHREAAVQPSIKTWERFEPAGGYLLDGANGPELVLLYTRGAPPFPSTEVTYALVRILWIGDRLGFVAEVAPPSAGERRLHP